MYIDGEYIVLYGTDGQVRWKLSDILYFEHLKNYITAYKADEEFSFRLTFGELDNIVKDTDFMVINKGLMINERETKLCHKYEIVLENGKTLSVSRNRYSKVYERMKKVNMLALFLI